jgi:hypothetical protein
VVTLFANTTDKGLGKAEIFKLHQFSHFFL